jgi:hypothetical protein
MTAPLHRAGFAENEKYRGAFPMDDIPAARRLADPTALCGASRSGPTVCQTALLPLSSLRISRFATASATIFATASATATACLSCSRAPRAWRRSTPRHAHSPIERVPPRRTPHQLAVAPRDGIRGADSPVHQERPAALPLHAAIPFCGHSRQIRARLRFLRHVCAFNPP